MSFIEPILFSSVVMSPAAYLWWRFNPWRNKTAEPDTAITTRAQNELLRKSPEYSAWRLAVLKRDRFQCVWWEEFRMAQCGDTLRIEVDHVYPLAFFPELALDVNNGRTLCHRHHTRTITYGSGAKVFYERIINAIRP